MAGLVRGTLVEMADKQMQAVEHVQKGDMIWDPYLARPVQVTKHMIGQVNTKHGMVSICKYMGLCAPPKQVVLCNGRPCKLKELVPEERQELHTFHCLVLEVGGRCVQADGVVCFCIDEHILMNNTSRHLELQRRGIFVSERT